MTQEEKQLLLKDLCMRIPYRTLVCLNPGAYSKPETCRLTGIDDEEVYLNVDSDPFRINNIKPYLRPMSSMTDDERKEWYKKSHVDYDCEFQPTPTLGLEHCHLSTDWLLEHHFDFRGLIEKGLALEAPDDMYKTE